MDGYSGPCLSNKIDHMLPPKPTDTAKRKTRTGYRVANHDWIGLQTDCGTAVLHECGGFQGADTGVRERGALPEWHGNVKVAVDFGVPLRTV